VIGLGLPRSVETQPMIAMLAHLVCTYAGQTIRSQLLQDYLRMSWVSTLLSEASYDHYFLKIVGFGLRTGSCAIKLAFALDQSPSYMVRS